MVQNKNNRINNNGRRWIAAGMALILSLLPVTSFAEEYSSGVAPTCDEAYYAMLDYYGNLQEGSVVKSYVLNGADTITDYGKYDEVTNLTDGTEPTYENGVTTFRFKEGEAPDHFYFQGSTREPYETLPWKISMQYQLNGVKKEAEDLAGEKGVVTVELNIVPNEAASQYAKNNYILMATTMFNQNDILSLKAEGAQVQLVGNLRTVIFAALPGEERHFTMEVGTDRFEFMGFTFLVVPATLAQLDMISGLQQNKDGVEENFNKLKGSIDETLDAMESMAGPLRSSAAGLNELNAARQTLSNEANSVSGDVDQINTDLDQFAVYTDPLYDEIQSASEAVSDAKSDLQALISTTSSLKEDIDAFRKILKKTKKDIASAQKNSGNMQKNIEKLQKDGKEIQTLVKDIRGMQSDIRTLRKNLENIKGIPGVVGINELTAQIQGLTAAYDTLTDGRSEARQTLDALSAAGGIQADGTIDANALFVLALMNNLGISQSEAATLAEAYTSGNTEAIASSGVSEETLQQIYAGAMDSKGQLESISGLYMAFGGAEGLENLSFKDFAKGILLSRGSDQDTAERNASVLELIYYYNKSGGNADLNRILEKMGEAEDEINGGIGQINTEIAGFRDPAVSMMKEIETVLSDLDKMNGLMKDLDEMGDDAVDTAKDMDQVLEHLDASVDQLDQSLSKGDTLIDELSAAYKTLNDHEPELQNALKDLQKISLHTSASIRDLSQLISDTEALAKKAGGALDSGTRKTLGGLSETLMDTADVMDSVRNIRSAKDTLTGIIEDVWKDHTGQLDNLLNMDNKAAPQSLTSSQNGTPTSIQYMIRSQEIKVDDSAQKEAEEESLKSKTFFGRVGTMFHDIGAAFTNAFK